MEPYGMGQLLADYDDDWATDYAPAPGGGHVLRAKRRDNPGVVLTAGDAAELRDAIRAWEATA